MQKILWPDLALDTNKASGGDRIPVELFQILKDDAVKANADVLLVFASPSQIVASMKDAVHLIKEKYGSDRPSETVIISGASKSTEIDNQLVIGAQGIKQIALFLVEEE